MPFFYFDYWYLVLVVPALLVSVWAQIKVKSTFSQYSNRAVGCRMTGAEASRSIQQVNGIHTGLEAVAGSLSDQYDPRNDKRSYLRKIRFVVHGLSTVDCTVNKQAILYHA